MSATMIWEGPYDASEVALLCGLTPDQIVRCSADTEHGDAPIHPSFDRLFSFDELVAFTVAKQVGANGISDRHLRSGVARLRAEHGVDNPLAVQSIVDRLATGGGSFLLHLGQNEFEDIGRGGQGTFKDVVKIYLRSIQFDGDRHPTNWVPYDGVSIDPAIQAGAPCLTDTRIPTATVVERAKFEDLARSHLTWRSTSQPSTRLHVSGSGWTEEKACQCDDPRVPSAAADARHCQALADFARPVYKVSPPLARFFCATMGVRRPKRD